MKPITNFDIAELLTPYLHEMPQHYTHVTLNIGQGGVIAELSNPPKNTEITRTQADRLLRSLAHLVNVPVEGVKKLEFAIAGGGNLTPEFIVTMRPVRKPSEKVHTLRVVKVDEVEEGEVLGQDVTAYPLPDSALIVVKPTGKQQDVILAIQSLQKQLAELNERATVVALSPDDVIENYRFEEVVTR